MEEAKTIEIKYIEHESHLYNISTICQHCLLLMNMQAG